MISLNPFQLPVQSFAHIPYYHFPVNNSFNPYANETEHNNLYMQELSRYFGRVNISADAPPKQESCLQARVAYDVGSGSTKVMGAIVDTCKMTIVDRFSAQSYSVLYSKDLQHSQGNFSESIRQEGLSTIKKAKIKAEKAHQQVRSAAGELQHCGAATAAFRAANNGEAFAGQISQQLGIKVDVIAQQQEGQLAYYGAVSKLGEEAFRKPLIVWDIGGGSMQITYRDPAAQFHMMGGDLASQTFLKLVLDKIFSDEERDSPNPMNPIQINQAVNLARQHLNFDRNATATISQQLEGGTVVGVGAVHNLVIKPLCQRFAPRSENFYTRADLAKAIRALANKTDAEILPLMPSPDPQFAKSVLTSMILVYAQMTRMGIERVQAVETSNVEGILLKGCDQPRRELRFSAAAQTAAKLGRRPMRAKQAVYPISKHHRLFRSERNRRRSR